MNIKYIQSPNFSDRLNDAVIDTIIIHHTNMESLSLAIERLCDRDAEVSAHYVISKTGDIYQLVRDEFKAWHAGLSCWRGRTGLNDYSIGVELENIGDQPFPNEQIDALISLCKDIMKRHKIDQRNVLGHYDVAPSRKDDPNHHFPWQKLAQKGVGLYPETEINNNLIFTNQVINFEINVTKEKLSKVGYNIPNDKELDTAMQYAIIAFKRHYCPESSNILGWDLNADAKLNKFVEMIDVK